MRYWPGANSILGYRVWSWQLQPSGRPWKWRATRTRNRLVSRCTTWRRSPLPRETSRRRDSKVRKAWIFSMKLVMKKRKRWRSGCEGREFEQNYSRGTRRPDAVESTSQKGREAAILIKMGWRERTRIKVYPAHDSTFS